MTEPDDLARAERVLQNLQIDLAVIPWWQFRKQNQAAKKYNNQLHVVMLKRKRLRRSMITIHIWFTDGTDKEVLGYHYWVDNGLLKIQTSSRQGGPESYEYYPLVNIKQWST